MSDHLRLVSTTIRDAEDAVLSAMLLDPAFAIPECVAAQLPHTAFSDHRNALMYRAMLWLYDNGHPVDPITLSATLEQYGKLGEVGGREHINLVMLAAPTAANVRYHAQIVRDAAAARAGDLRAKHEAVQAEQVRDAIVRLDLPDAAFLRFPWPALDAVMGGHGPGTMGFVIARLKSGKTSFLLSLMQRLFASGRRIYYAGLESRPLNLRTQWACRQLHLDPGDVLSGEYRRWMNRDQIRADVKAALAVQHTDPAYLRVRFAPHPRVDIKVMHEICVEAHEFGADVVVVDHIDHIRADGSPYVASREVVEVAKELTHRYDLHLIAASQINREGMAGDPFRNYRPVREEHVKMGDQKLEACDWAIGVYRPLRSTITKQDRADFEAGKLQIHDLLADYTMAINVMAHRLYGSRAGTKVDLGFFRGEVYDTPDLARQAQVAARYLAA